MNTIVAVVYRGTFPLSGVHRLQPIPFVSVFVEPPKDMRGGPQDMYLYHSYDSYVLPKSPAIVVRYPTIYLLLCCTVVVLLQFSYF